MAKKTEQKEFTCSRCGRSFKSAQSLNAHAIKAHRKPQKKTGPFECKQCGRTFKNMQGLGSHAARAHQKQQNNVTDPANGKIDEEKSVQVVAAPGEEASEAEQIRYYLQQGIDYDDLVTKLHFKESTVRQEVGKMLIRNRQTVEANQVESLLPVVLKDGKGESISPEAVYYQLVLEDGIDGERDFKALMKWAASIELAQRMARVRTTEVEAIGKMFEPMLAMIDKSRQELDAAAQRNQESMMQVASAAAGEAAARVAAHDDERFNRTQERKKDIAEVQDPMKGLMARTMETVISQITSQMFGGGQAGQQALPPAWKDERQGGS